jgi:eukaryotic-like serine/threonine-protein kinase
MAEVYRAKDTRLGRDVAIKVVSEALGADAAFLERFEREAKLAASLAHPNVVALHDVGFHDGKPYFVTELLLGESLRERLAKGPIPLATALEWAAQMAQGLAAAHERGIAHRDLKPENVFITRDGHVKLLDFGIAKLIETAQAATPHGLMDPTVSPSGSSTGTGMVLGTPGYMSPEQVRGDAVDARTDFFSLGAVLYEMLSGHRAFPAGPVVESGYAILHNEPEQLPGMVPPQVAQVVHRCLEKDPTRRFQSARDLAFNLELVRTPTGSAAPTATGPGVASPLQRRRRWVWLLPAVLAALGAGGATYFVMRPIRPSFPSVELMTFRRGTVSAGRFSPDGRVVYGAAWEAEPEEIFTHAPGTSDAQSLGVPGAHLLSVASQGELAVLLRPVGVGNRITTRGGTLALVPGVGGVAREVSENIVFADWSPTGELAVVRSVEGKRQLEYPLGTPLFESTGYIGFPRVSPAGNAVAFWNYLPDDPAPNELVLVDRQGAIRRLLDVKQMNGLAWAPNGEEVWFTNDAAIWASPLSGGRRLVYQGVTNMALEDISRDGKVLVNIEDERAEIGFVPPGQQREVELPWLKTNYLGAISDDGRRVLFTSSVNKKSVTYVRPTDGSPPLKLGPGIGLAFSPDEKWVLMRTTEDSSVLSILPVGVGVSKKPSVEGLNFSAAQWLRDGKRLVVNAQRKGEKQFRLFVVPLEGGAPIPLSDAPLVSGVLEVSRDDRFAAAVRFDGTLTLYPLDRSPPIPLPDLMKSCVPVGWTSDGQLWVRAPSNQLVELARNNPNASRGFSGHLLRYDIPSRRVVEERAFAPDDLTGLTAIGNVHITPDSRAIAFTTRRSLGYLYLLDGLAPPRR